MTPLKQRFIEKKIREILEEEEKLDIPDFGDVTADKVAMFGGSWLFIILFVLFCFGWILFNVFIYSYDPFPFILLNLGLSCVAAIQAPIIIMSQNRQAERDRRREENAYRINLKNDMVLTSLYDELQKFRKELKNDLSD